MKVRRLDFDIPYAGKVDMEDIECTPEEFKGLLETVVKLGEMEIEKEKQRVINLPKKPEVT